MKILMISYNQVGHGTYLRTYEFARELAIARELAKLGQQITIMATSQKRNFDIETWEENGIRIVTFPSVFKKGPRSGWDPYSIITRSKWIKSNKFDIVHGFESRPTVIYPAIRLMKKGIPLVLDWCDWFGKGGSVEERPNQLLKLVFRPFETFYENNFRTKPDFTTVICRTLYQRAIDLGVKPESISLIPNGLNMPGWKHVAKDFARDKFGYHSRDFVIGYVGSLFPKDAVLMTNTLTLLSQKLPNVKLLHLGRSNYISNTEHPNITITGDIHSDNLQIGLAACDICWLPLSDIPANWGRFPLKFTNYLAAGKPILATDVGDIPEYIKSHNVGIVCKPNGEAISNAVIQLAEDLVILKHYSKNSLKLSNSQDHSWKNLAKLLMGHYENLLK
ncbi:MAG: glycosyltransferase [Candidatus Helarchaeota archaeon]